MTISRKNIVAASAVALVLGLAIAGTSTPAAADDAGPLGWTYNIETGTYEVTKQDTYQETSQSVIKDLEVTDAVSLLTFDSSHSGS